VEPTAEPTPEPTPELSAEATPESTVEPSLTASDEPTSSDEPVVGEPAVTGSILLPEGSTLEGADSWSLQIEDTSLADAPATIIAEDGGTISDETATELEFAVAYDPGSIDDRNTYTLRASVLDADGNLMFTNDTAIGVLTNDAPTDDVDVPVVLVAAFSPMASEVPTAVPSE
jgi:putative lipoprotein